MPRGQKRKAKDMADDQFRYSLTAPSNCTPALLQAWRTKPLQNVNTLHLFRHDLLEAADLRGYILTSLLPSLPTDPTTHTLYPIARRSSHPGSDVHVRFNQASTSPPDASGTDIARVSKYLDHLFWPRWSSEIAIKASENEEAMYAGPLAPLQGNVIPQRYGLFEGCLSADNRIRLMVLEDVGVFAGGKKGLKSGLTLNEKRVFINHYRGLHAARVLHKDVKDRHFLRRKDGRFALIDFEGAEVVEEGEEGDAKLEKEMVEVRRTLGLALDGQDDDDDE
ncbi:hypothetical protein IAT38_000934 [Cryptococcus sp. DSM 104549]